MAIITATGGAIAGPETDSMRNAVPLRSGGHHPSSTRRSARVATAPAPEPPEWPLFDADARATMTFDTTIEPCHDVGPELWSAW